MDTHLGPPSTPVHEGLWSWRPEPRNPWAPAFAVGAAAALALLIGDSVVLTFVGAGAFAAAWTLLLRVRSQRESVVLTLDGRLRWSLPWNTSEIDVAAVGPLHVMRRFNTTRPEHGPYVTTHYVVVRPADLDPPSRWTQEIRRTLGWPPVRDSIVVETKLPDEDLDALVEALNRITPTQKVYGGSNSTR